MNKQTNTILRTIFAVAWPVLHTVLALMAFVGVALAIPYFIAIERMYDNADY